MTLAVATSTNRQSILRPGESHSPLNALSCRGEALLGSSSILGSHRTNLCLCFCQDARSSTLNPAYLGSVLSY